MIFIDYESINCCVRHFLKPKWSNNNHFDRITVTSNKSDRVRAGTSHFRRTRQCRFVSIRTTRPTVGEPTPTWRQRNQLSSTNYSATAGHSWPQAKLQPAETDVLFFFLVESCRSRSDWKWKVGASNVISSLNPPIGCLLYSQMHCVHNKHSSSHPYRLFNMVSASHNVGITA